MALPNESSEVLTALSGLQSSITNLSLTMARVETQVQQLAVTQAQHATFADRITKLEARCDAADRQSQLNRWLVGVVLSLLVAVLYLAANHVQWK